jgi:hypothetical protein
MALGQFPKSVRISKGCVGWYEDEIIEWQEARERTHELPPCGRKARDEQPNGRTA